MSSMHADSDDALDPGRSGRCLFIAATFTAEPVSETVDFWMEALGHSVSVRFAPYNQVFQQLLDPGSELSRNQDGLNVVLVRLEDWVRSPTGTEGLAELEESLFRSATDLIDAATAAAARTAVPLLIGVCPDSPGACEVREKRELFTAVRERIRDALEEVAGVYLLGSADFDLYPVAEYHDSQRDELGRIPYTPLFFAALGTILARKAHALLSAPHKVIVLDCDNTLWKGVVGEEGVDGISIQSPFSGLQRFMAERARQGFLLCLCSKNDESDVMSVFERRPDMILKRDDLVSWRINWEPKSNNIRALAQELNLGLDSFIFLDDNPVECAEVRAGCPEVATLRLPIDSDVETFLRHVWAFDRLRVTSADRQRTTMYKQEADRVRLRQQAPTIEEFIAGLGLVVAVSSPAPDQIERVAQLTERTNQFNFTTVRRNERAVAQLAESGLECLIVEVSDRFGDYGLAGVMIFGTRGSVLEVDTFLLSCRVLGRGVEHRMFKELGAIAVSRHLATVAARLIPTAKNQPARAFLQEVAGPYGREVDGSLRYDVPAEVVASLAFRAAQPRALLRRRSRPRCRVACRNTP